MDELQKEDFEDLGNISQVLAGRKEAFAPIIARYEKLMFKIAYNFLGKNAELEDAVQDIFLETYKSLPNFKLGKRFLPWLYSIALNVLRKRYRKVLKIRKIQTTLEQLEQPEPVHPYELVERNAMQHQIRQAVHSLPANLKEIVVLFYMEDLKINEICAILNIGNENVKSRLFRARKKLKNLLTNVQLNFKNGQQ